MRKCGGSCSVPNHERSGSNWERTVSACHSDSLGQSQLKKSLIKTDVMAALYKEYVAILL